MTLSVLYDTPALDFISCISLADIELDEAASSAIDKHCWLKVFKSTHVFGQGDLKKFGLYWQQEATRVGTIVDCGRHEALKQLR